MRKLTIALLSVSLFMMPAAKPAGTGKVIEGKITLYNKAIETIPETIKLPERIGIVTTHLTPLVTALLQDAKANTDIEVLNKVVAVLTKSKDILSKGLTVAAEQKQINDIIETQSAKIAARVKQIEGAAVLQVFQTELETADKITIYADKLKKYISLRVKGFATSAKKEIFMTALKKLVAERTSEQLTTLSESLIKVASYIQWLINTSEFDPETIKKYTALTPDVLPAIKNTLVAQAALSKEVKRDPLVAEFEVVDKITSYEDKLAKYKSLRVKGFATIEKSKLYMAKLNELIEKRTAEQQDPLAKLISSVAGYIQWLINTSEFDPEAIKKYTSITPDELPALRDELTTLITKAKEVITAVPAEGEAATTTEEAAAPVGNITAENFESELDKIYETQSDSPDSLINALINFVPSITDQVTDTQKKLLFEKIFTIFERLVEEEMIQSFKTPVINLLDKILAHPPLKAAALEEGLDQMKEEVAGI